MRRKPAVRPTQNSRRAQESRCPSFVGVASVSDGGMDIMDYLLHDGRMCDVLDYRENESHEGQPLALWIEPASRDYRRAACELIKAHSEASFKPHVTVAALVRGDPEAMLRCAEALASVTSPFEIPFERMCAGPTYFQSAYLCAEPESVPALTTLRANAYATLRAAGLPPSLPEQPYLPHLSLAYRRPAKGGVGPAALPKPLPKPLLQGASPLRHGFEAHSITVWLTDIDDLSTRSWRRLGRFPLVGGASISGPVARLVGCGPRQVRPCTGRAGCMCDECNASRNSLDL